MAYTIDYTAAYHARRRVWAWFFSGVFVLALAGAGKGLLWISSEWMRPTLAYKLEACHRIAVTVEERDSKWKNAVAAYGAIAPWYRLYWRESATAAATNLLDRSVNLPAGLKPVRWELRSGGSCRLIYACAPEESNKKTLARIEETGAQLRELVEPWSASATILTPSNLIAGAKEMKFQAEFSLRSTGNKDLPGPPAALSNAVANIAKLRKAVLAHKLKGSGVEDKPVATWLEEARQAAEPLLPEAERAQWKTRAERAVDPAMFLKDLETALSQVGAAPPRALKDAATAWDSVALRRWPWQRDKMLDTQGLEADLGRLTNLLARIESMKSSLFDVPLERALGHRDALMAGFTEADLRFGEEEGYLSQWVFPDGSVKAWKFVVPNENQPTQGGLAFKKWTLTVNAAGGAGTGGFSANDVVARMDRIPSLEAGFVVESLDLDFDPSTAQLKNAVAKGLLAVKADVPEDPKLLADRSR